VLTPKHKATKLGIAPRSQSYQRSAEVADDLNVGGTSFFSKTDPKILTPCHPLFVPGYYYASALTSGSNVSWDDFPANTIYVFAYPIPRKLIVSKIAIHIGGASGTAGSTLRMGLYDAGNPDILGTPYNLIRDFGAVATDSIGVKVIDFSDDKLTLIGDLYWLVLNNSHAGVDIGGVTSTMGVLGDSETPRNSSGFRIDYAYGAFPSIFPSGTKTLHIIGLRYGFWVNTVLE